MATSYESMIEQERRWEVEMDLKVVHNGFTRGDLKKVFSAVQNPTDWKAPIAVMVPGELVNITVAAIQFFTGTNPRVGLHLPTMRYAIESEGYRAGPAGDH